MAYVKQVWHDAPATDSPITSAALGHIEEGVYEVDQFVERASVSKTLVYESIWSQSGAVNFGYTPGINAPMDCNLSQVIVNCRVPNTSSSWEIRVQLDGTDRAVAIIPSSVTHFVITSDDLDFDGSLAAVTADDTVIRLYIDDVGSGEATDISVTLRFS